MKGHINTDIGEVMIDHDVLAKYAGASAVECFGVVGMASVNMKDGIVKLLKKDNLSHGVNVIIDEKNKITIDLHIIVSYGVSISAVADNLISNVKYNVEEFSGLEVDKTIYLLRVGNRLTPGITAFKEEKSVIVKTIDAKTFKNVSCWAASLEAKKEYINELNVFPVQTEIPALI